MEAIRLDQNGIYINGKYQTLLASSLFYFRIPRERWNDRMKLLKTAGYQAIDVYFPWNYHETAPDVWDFEGNKDVESFLKLAAENELFVIARPGPYICSEWDGGAIPAWLSEKRLQSDRMIQDFYLKCETGMRISCQCFQSTRSDSRERSSVCKSKMNWIFIAAQVLSVIWKS